jgi:sugar lactone lactonase YvrE
MSRDANPNHAWLYVAGYNSNNVLIYDLERLGVPEIGAITTGIDGPGALFLDASGTLYVPNQPGNTVTIYPAGATTPSVTLSQGLSRPNSVAIDGEGNIWVANFGSSPSIVIYPPGSMTPSQTITGRLIKAPAQLAFDSSGNTFFSDNDTGVNEIPAGSTQPFSLGLKKFPNQLTGLAVKPDDDTLYTSFGNSTNQVNVYAPHHRLPERILYPPTADYLTLANLGHHLDLFVPGSLSNSVAIFRDDATRPFATLSVGTQYTQGVAIKPPGVP